MSIFGHTKDVGRQCITWANQELQMTWVAFNPQNVTSIEDYAFNGGPNPTPPTADTKAVCFDLMLLALLNGGWTDARGLKQIYEDIPNNGLIATGLGGGMSPYTLNSGNAPELGHLVFFNRLQHVCISTGNIVNVNQAEVVTFWGGTKSITGPVLTEVLIDTIENINTSCFNSSAVITEAKPRWR